MLPAVIVTANTATQKACKPSLQLSLETDRRIGAAQSRVGEVEPAPHRFDLAYDTRHPPMRLAH